MTPSKKEKLLAEIEDRYKAFKADQEKLCGEISKFTGLKEAEAMNKCEFLGNAIKALKVRLDYVRKSDCEPDDFVDDSFDDLTAEIEWRFDEIRSFLKDQPVKSGLTIKDKKRRNE